MRIFLVFCIYAVVNAYDHKDEVEDIEEVFQHPEKIQAYMSCFLDEGPCTSHMQHFKSHLEEAEKEFCRECTPSQKEKVAKNLKLIYSDKYAEEMKVLRARYDPENIIYEKYLKKLM